MKLQDTLDEGLSPTLYHFTHVENIIKILEKNAIRMRPYVGNDAELGIGKKKKLYFLSTTRSKRGGYTVANDSYGVMTLDGRKLGRNYKGNPIEYWGSQMRDIDQERRTTEMEDRIFGDKPEIPNIKKYIVNIQIKIPEKVDVNKLFAFPSNKNDEDRDKRRIRKLLMMCKKAGIPIYFYRNKNDFLNHNKSKAEKIDIKSLKTGVEKRYPTSSGGMSKFAKKDLGPVIELYKKSPGQKLSKEADHMRAAIVYREYDREKIGQGTDSAISSNAKDNLPVVNKVVQIIQKLNFTKGTELINYLAKKWTEEED